MNNLPVYKSPFPEIISNKENTYIGNSLIPLDTCNKRSFEEDSISPSSVWEQINFQNQTNSPKPKSEDNKYGYKSPGVSQYFINPKYSGAGGSAKKQNYEISDVDAIPFSLNSPTADQLNQTYIPPISKSWSTGKGRKRSSMSPGDVPAFNSHKKVKLEGFKKLNKAIKVCLNNYTSDCEGIGTISITFHIKEDLNTLLIAFSSSKGNDGALNDLLKNEAFKNELIECLKQNENKFSMIETIKFKAVAQQNSNYSYQKNEEIAKMMAYDGMTENQSNLLNKIKNKTIEKYQVAIKNEPLTIPDKIQLIQLIEFEELLNGTFNQQSIEERNEQVNDLPIETIKTLPDIIQLAISNRAELIYNSLDESILTISKEEALERIELALYLYDHNPLCAEKNIFYLESKFCADVTSIEFNDKIFAFVLTKNKHNENVFSDIKMCESCKVIHSIQ